MGHDPIDADLARLVGDDRAAQARRERVRERHLRESAAAESTLVGIIVDLAERGRDVRITTDTGRTVTGVISLVGLDVVIVDRTYVALAGVVSIRVQEGRRSVPRAADRSPARPVSLAAIIGDLAVARPRVAVSLRGEAQLLTGDLVAAGADVVTIRSDGSPASMAYVSLGSLSTLAVLASG